MKSYIGWKKARDLVNQIYRVSRKGGFTKGSAGEVVSQAYIALDQKYISETEFNEVHRLAIETSKMIGGFIEYLKSSKLKGPKYSTRN